MNMTEDPLDVLFEEEKVDEKMIKQIIGEILVNYVRLSQDGGIFPLPEFDNLNRFQKLLIYLLAKKALYVRQLVVNELTPPSEIRKNTGLPMGTVNPSLRQLERDRLVKSDLGRYKIPNYALNKIKTQFQVAEVYK